MKYYCSECNRELLIGHICNCGNKLELAPLDSNKKSLYEVLKMISCFKYDVYYNIKKHYDLNNVLRRDAYKNSDYYFILHYFQKELIKQWGKE